MFKNGSKLAPSQMDVELQKSLNEAFVYNPLSAADSSCDLINSVDSKKSNSEKISSHLAAVETKNNELASSERDISVYVIYGIVFVSGASRGILFPMLWTLCQDLGGNITDLSYLSAIFGVGRFLAQSPLGYMSDKLQYKIPLLLASTFVMIASFLWANTYSTRNIGCLYVAQLLMGFGSGTLGVVRGYVVERSTPKDRTSIMAFVTALQYAGQTVSSLLGSALGYIGVNMMSSKYWQYALPGYTMFLLSLYCFVALLVIFKDTERIAVEPDVAITMEEAIELSGKKEKLPGMSSEMFILLTMILLNIGVKGSMSVYETIGAQIGSQAHHMSSVAVGTLFSLTGLVGFVQLLLFKSFWCVYFTDIQLMLGGFAVMIVAQLVIVALIQRSSTADFITSTSLMYAIGFPIGQTAVLGAFSKVQKKGVQGTLMGLFATAGAFSRIIMPLVCGMARNNGPFCVNICMLTMCVMGVILLRKRIEVFTTDIALPGGGETSSDQRFSFRTWSKSAPVVDKILVYLSVLLFVYGVIVFTIPTENNAKGGFDPDLDFPDLD